MKAITNRMLHVAGIAIATITVALVNLEAQNTPPSLNAESFMISVTGRSNDMGQLALQGNCLAFPATFTFQGSGQASSPLNPNGTFTETGSFTIAAGSTPGTFVMTAFQAGYSFPITNPPGQVTGTKSLNPQGLNQA